MTSTDREKMMQEINDAKLSRKEIRMMLIGLSMIPHIPTQLRFKLMLRKMDTEDYGAGKISKNTLAIKTALRFIPIGGLAMAAFDTGSELLSEAVFFSAENLKEMTDEDLEMLYAQIKKA